jgi:Cdc6-like AAA superfamily ATPase
MVRLELRSLDHTGPQLEENFANVFATFLEMIGHSTKAIARKRWKEYLVKMLQGNDQKIEQLHKRLERLVRDGTSLVVEEINTNVTTIVSHTAKTAIQVENIQANTNTMGTDIVDVKNTSRLIMDLLQKQHQSQCSDKTHSILRPSQTNIDKMEGILRDRVPGTGNWLLSEPAFQSWLHRNESLLWLHGRPGCGKTFLASAVVSLLQSNITKGLDGWQNNVIGFFFLSKNDAYTVV